jgi:hypothetical protein
LAFTCAGEQEPGRTEKQITEGLLIPAALGKFPDEYNILRPVLSLLHICLERHGLVAFDFAVLTSLISIPESLKPLDHFATRRCPLVRTPELILEQACDDQDQSRGNERPFDTRTVARSILVAEDGRTYNSTDTTSSNESSGCKSTLPLAADVVGLIGQDAWHVGVARSCGEEDSEVAGKMSVDFGVKCCFLLTGRRCHGRSRVEEAQ